MSRALRESGSPFDIPRFLFKTSLWSWFLYRTGEELFYYLLQRLNIPHTPKWKYNPELKYSENMTNKERWKKSKLFESSSTGNGTKSLQYGGRSNKPTNNRKAIMPS